MQFLKSRNEKGDIITETVVQNRNSNKISSDLTTKDQHNWKIGMKWANFWIDTEYQS